MARPRPFTILIVEDEALLAMSLQLLIEQDGNFQTFAAIADLREALAVLDRGRPDFALVDLRLRDGQSGLAVATELTKCKIPNILMTGNPPISPLPEISLGCLSKPFSDEGLFATLKIARALIENVDAGSSPPRELQLYV